MSPFGFGNISYEATTRKFPLFGNILYDAIRGMLDLLAHWSGMNYNSIIHFIPRLDHEQK